MMISDKQCPICGNNIVTDIYDEPFSQCCIGVAMCKYCGMAYSHNLQDIQKDGSEKDLCDLLSACFIDAVQTDYGGRIREWKNINLYEISRGKKPISYAEWLYNKNSK